MPDKLLSLAETAELLGFSIWTVRDMVYAREIGCVRKSPKGRIRIRESEVDRWVRRHELRAARSQEPESARQGLKLTPVRSDSGPKRTGSNAQE